MKFLRLQLRSSCPAAPAGPSPRTRAATALLCPLLVLLPVFAWDDQPALPPEKTGPAPHAVLDNGRLRVTLMHPDPDTGYYRQRRFISAGIIPHIQAGPHTFTGPGSLGLACEFETPIPLPPLTPNGPSRILKIGVGTFTLNSNEPRALRNPHWEQRAVWERQALPDGIRYRQIFQEPTGHAYTLTKEIRLNPEDAVLTLAYRLENTGAHPLNSTHYVHNFFQIDGNAIGPDIVLELPFPLKENLLEEKRRNGARLHGSRLVFDPVDKPTPSATWLVFTPRDAPADNRSILRNTRTGAQVTISGDWPRVQHKIYATRNEFCPEHFIVLDLAPGTHAAWQLHYHFNHPSP